MHLTFSLTDNIVNKTHRLLIIQANLCLLHETSSDLNE